MNDTLQPLFGGVLIGISASLMLFLHGRVAGITGILVGATMERTRGDWLWRGVFLLGLIAGGTLMTSLVREAHVSTSPKHLLVVGCAGLLVGFGTRLGSGCTSGHGVCGVSRLSRRSLAATATFVAAGMFTVFVTRHVLGAGGTP